MGSNKNPKFKGKKSTKAKRPVVARKVEPVVVRLSDSVTLIHGDCLECGPFKADAVITDPPYGIAWDTDYRRFTRGFDVPRKNHTPVANDAKPFDPTPWLGFKTVVLFGANCYAAKLPVGSWLVWDKRFANGKAFLADGEVAWLNRGHGLYIYSETAQGFVRKEPIEHPTQKPVGVMEWCMDRAKVPQGATVLDPYMGSGTTGIACIRTGRKFIGIEIDAGHFETARKRLERELSQGTFDFGGGAVAPTHNTVITETSKQRGLS